jgi:type 1 glutamine amidotransferase
MRGLPLHWLHVEDELYQNQRGPIGDLHLLATAYADPQFKGTGMNEPMVFTLHYGKGRVFVSLLGHDVPATVAPDSATLLARGSEWAATGEVTIPVAPDFPRPRTATAGTDASKPEK